MKYYTYGRSSDLLPVILPSQFLLYKVEKSGFDLNTVIELTAAGQLRIHTVFPFNPGITIPGTKSVANVLNNPTKNKLSLFLLD